MLLVTRLLTPTLCVFMVLDSRTVRAQDFYAQDILGDQSGVINAGSQIPGSTSGLGSCHATCASLAEALPHSFNATRSPSFISSFFTVQQSSVIPACILQPHSAEEVAVIVRILAASNDENREDGCIFAIRSGGHATFAGASNAPGGVTIDLCYLDEVKLSKDHETVALGPGARWDAVYQVLRGEELVVVGGRDDSVGVGGFLLGGGISFISRRYGWAFDNIRNFQVVLANGSIIEANLSANSDLYYALRGGGSNFGIVTRFDVEAYPRAPMWGGFKLCLLEDIPHRKEALNVQRPFEATSNWILQKLGDSLLWLACRLGFCTSSDMIIHAFENIVANWDSDPLAQMFIAISMVDRANIWAMFVSQVYGKAETEPAIFQGLKAVATIYKTTRIADISDLTKELASLNTAGDRQLWNEFTFRVNSTLMLKLLDIFVEICDPMWKLPGAVPALDFMIISKDEIKHFSKNRGNALGLEKEEEPFLLVLIAFRWSSATQDAAVSTIVDSLRTRFVAIGKEMGLYHPYTYQNYAYKTEDVFAGYGVENRARLRRINGAYDPNGLFGKRMPGYFKV